MDFTFNRMLRSLYLVTLIFTATALGAVYAIHNTDPHHWGFILGPALDFIYGRELFTQVYVQYGVGIPLLLKAINSVWQITYTNIGFFTSAVYAATLGILFLSIEKLSSTKFAVALTIIAFLFHPYAIFPWPDYYAGFFLALACYVLLPASSTPTPGRDVIAGILLFLAFLFRNTYLVNLLAGAGTYFVLSLLFPKLKDTRLSTAIATFVVLVALYLGFLSIQGKLPFWYRQNFGAVTTAYQIGKGSTELWLLRAVAPDSIRSVAVTVALWVNAYVIFVILRRARSSGTLEPMGAGITLFMAILGGAGLVQGLQFYEPFRLQNACSPLYLGVACFLSWHPAGSSHEIRRPPAIWVLATLILAMGVEAPRLFNGRAHTTIWPLIEKPRDFFGKPLTGEPARKATYSWSQGIPVFRGHRFLPDVQSYYQSLSDVLCKSDKKIVNLTNDSMVPYLCEGPRNALFLPNYPYSLLGKISPEQLARVERGEYAADELVVADSPPPIARDRRFVKVGSVARPYQLRWNRANKTVWIFAVEPQEAVNDGPQIQTLPGASEVEPKAD